jgi:hypothetical protein
VPLNVKLELVARALVEDAYKSAPEVNDVRFVPPLAVASVPAKVIVPDVVIGPPDVVKPVVPPDTATLETVPVEAALDANNLTVPALFLKYSFSSNVFSANSPATKLPEVGTAEAVVL